MHRSPIRKPLLVALAISGLVLASHARAGSISLGRIVKKPASGFSIQVPEGWDEIPPQPESFFVGHFMGKDPLGAPPELNVVRFKSKPEPVAGSGGSKKAEKKNLFQAKSVEELLKLSNKDLPRPTDLKIDDLAAHLYEFTLKSQDPRGQGRVILAASIPAPDGEFGVLYEANERFYKRDYRSAYLASIKSFRLIAEAEVADRAPAGSREALREQKHALVRGIPGWYAIDTENYVLLSDCPDKDPVREIAHDIEKIRKEVYEVVFPPTRPITALSVVRVCATMEEYIRYGGPTGSAGFWNDESEELVFPFRFTNQSKKKSRKNSLSVLYHEAFHQYIYYSVGEVAPHSWFNEGHGDFFAGSVKVGGKFEVQPFNWRVNVVKVAANTGKLVPLEKFLYFSQAEYYTNASQNYAQGWALVYFLRKVTKNPQWKSIPDVYFSYLKDHLPKKEPEPAGATDPLKPKNPGEPPPEGKPEPPAPGTGPAPPPPSTPPDDGGDEDEPPPPPPPPGKVPKNKEEARVLKEAVDKALEGVNLGELEKAYTEWVKKL